MKSHEPLSVSPQQTTLLTADKFGFCDIVTPLHVGEIRYH